MSQLTHLPASGTDDAVLEILDRDGALVIDDAATPEQLTSLRSEIEPFLDAADLGTNSFTGRHTKRIGALIARSATCRALAEHPTVLAASDAVLGRNASGYQLHFSQVVSIGPDETAQPLHRDRGLWGGYIPRSIETQVSTVWALSPFTAANGATQVVPGSHEWHDERVATDAEITQADMSPGSVLLYNGSVLHGGGTNTTTSERRDGVLFHYTLNWLRQEENQYLSCPPHLAADLAESTRSLIGYSQGQANLGFYSEPHLGGVELADPAQHLPTSDPRTIPATTGSTR